MRQVHGPGALGRPRGIGQRGKWEEGLGREGDGREEQDGEYM